MKMRTFFHRCGCKATPVMAPAARLKEIQVEYAATECADHAQARDRCLNIHCDVHEKCTQIAEIAIGAGLDPGNYPLLKSVFYLACAYQDDSFKGRAQAEAQLKNDEKDLEDLKKRVEADAEAEMFRVSLAHLSEQVESAAAALMSNPADMAYPAVLVRLQEARNYIEAQAEVEAAASLQAAMEVLSIIEAANKLLESVTFPPHRSILNGVRGNMAHASMDLETAKDIINKVRAAAKVPA